MREFKYFEEQAGVSAEYPKRTTPEYRHVFYKNGGVIGECFAGEKDKYNSLYELTKIHERIDIRDEDHEKAIAAYHAARSTAYDLWVAALKEEYPEITPTVFSRIYTLVSQNLGYGDSYDVLVEQFDEIASIVVFALSEK